MLTKIIYGWSGREGDFPALPYLTRYVLIKARSWQLCLHVFHRSDFPDWHDHPWDFLTLVLWRGYIENLLGVWLSQNRPDALSTGVGLPSVWPLP